MAKKFPAFYEAGSNIAEVTKKEKKACDFPLPESRIIQ
jgi:hypothetical protein